MKFFRNFRRRTRERIIVVLAMRRSGHHAVVNQLCYQIGNVLHLNNCTINRNGTIVPIMGGVRLYDERGVMNTGAQSYEQYFKLMAEIKFMPNMVYSFEDAAISINFPKWVEPHRSYTTVCVVRDPFNWLASSLQHGGRMTDNTALRIKLWKKQVLQCLSPDTYPYGHFVDINYNRWVLDRTYRQQVSDRLGLDYSEEGLNEVLKFGPGSSFDGTQFDGKASEMKVLERWKFYEHDEQYRSYFEDRELIDLSARYFEFNPWHNGDDRQSYRAAGPPVDHDRHQPHRTGVGPNSADNT